MFQKDSAHVIWIIIFYNFYLKSSLMEILLVLQTPQDEFLFSKWKTYKYTENYKLVMIQYNE